MVADAKSVTIAHKVQACNLNVCQDMLVQTLVCLTQTSVAHQLTNVKQDTSAKLVRRKLTQLQALKAVENVQLATIALRRPIDQFHACQVPTGTRIWDKPIRIVQFVQSEITVKTTAQ